MIRKLAQVASWLLLGAIVVLTFVPPGLRPVTSAPHNFEHALIFLVTGVAFAVGYRIKMTFFFALAVAFCAALEVLQNIVPGRHARLSDFVVDGIAACIGLAFGSVVARHRAL